MIDRNQPPSTPEPGPVGGFFFQAPKKTDKAISPGITRPRVGIDARTLFFDGSMERGIGQYTMHHLPATVRLRPEWEFVLLVEEPFPNQYVKSLSDIANVSVELIDKPTGPFDFYHIIDPLSILPGGDSPFRLFKGPFTAVAYDLIPFIMRSYHFDHWPAYSQIAYLSRLRQLKEQGVRLLAISEHTKQDFVRLAEIPAENITSIMAGLNAAPQASPDESEINETLKRLEIRPPFVLTVGGLDPHKNFPMTVSSVVQSRRAIPSLQLVAVGGNSDPFKRTFQEVLAREGIGNVLFPGFLSRQELTCLYKRAVCLSFPSIYEGFGFPVLEALANGCPVVCSNCSSLPEVGGEAAMLFEHSDVDGMAGAYTRLLSDSGLRQTLIAKGYEQSRKFSWELTGQKTVQVWDQMVSTRQAMLVLP